MESVDLTHNLVAAQFAFLVEVEANCFDCRTNSDQKFGFKIIFICSAAQTNFI